MASNSAIELAIALAKRFEGLRLKAYLCPAGVPSVGYGATGADIALGMVVTASWADERLKRDVARFMRATLLYCPDLEDEALGAITDFTFNLGPGRLKTSTLRRKINAGLWDQARIELGKWVIGGGKRLPGLVLRRAAESEYL